MYASSKICLNYTRLRFVQGDIRTLSSLFENRYFDTVCHSGVMEHFSDNDIIKILSEQKNISKRVVFTIPNNRNKLTAQHFGNERFLSNKKWVKLIREAGFSNARVFGSYDLPKYLYFVLPGVFFHRKASFWWKYFSRHSVFVCE